MGSACREGYPGVKRLTPIKSRMLNSKEKHKGIHELSWKNASRVIVHISSNSDSSRRSMSSSSSSNTRIGRSRRYNTHPSIGGRGIESSI